MRSSDIDDDFVDAVAPDMTLVTVGRDNRYGHPTAPALRVYQRHGPVFRTDLDGHVVVCPGHDDARVHTSLRRRDAAAGQVLKG